MKNKSIKIIALIISLITICTTMTYAETGFSDVQEATSGIISLPENSVKGQISDGKFYGVTRTNLVKNGNGESGDTSYWEGILYWNGEYFYKSNDTYLSNGRRKIKVEVGKTYTISLIGYVSQDALNAQRIGINQRDSSGNVVGSGSAYNLDFTGITNPTKKNTSITVEAGVEEIWIYPLISEGTIYFKEVLIEETNEVKSYITGTKSTLCAFRQRSVSKNILPHDLEYWEQGAISTSTGGDVASTTRLRMKKFERIKSDTSITLSALSGYNTYVVFFYDFNKNYIGYGTMAPENAYYYRSIVRKADDSTITLDDMIPARFQIEYGDSATEVIKHDNDKMYVYAVDENGNVLEAHSLDNGTKDEVSDGKVNKRTKKEVLGSVDFVSINTSGSNVDLVYTKTFTDNKLWTLEINNYINIIGYEQIDGNSALWDNTDYIGKAYTGADNTVRFIVSKTAYTDYADKGYSSRLEYAQADLAGTSLIYQLATPVQYEIPVTPLIGYPNGTVIIEPVINEAGVYNGGMTIKNGNCPIEAGGIESIKRIESNSIRTEIDLSNVTVASDGKSFAIDGADDGELYEYTYYYPQELTAIPTMTYSVPVDETGQINGLTNMVEQNSNLIDLILQEIQVIKDEV